MIPYPQGKEDRPITTIEGVRERLSEPLDYVSLVLWKLISALSMKPGSKMRQLELNDVEDLLFPYLDRTFSEEMERLDKEIETKKADPKNDDWEASYHRGRVRILLGVMKRNDLLPIGMI